MKEFRFLLMFFVIISCSFIQCSKTPIDEIAASFTAGQRSSLPTAFELLEILKEPVNGYICIGSQISLVGQDNRDGGILLQSQMNTSSGYVDAGTLKIGPYSIPYDAAQQYVKYGNLTTEQLYGQKLDISLEGSSSFPALPSTSINTAKKMSVTSSADLELHNNAHITWESDPTNSLGVGMAILFDRGSPHNFGKPYNAYAPVTNVIHTEDDGSYHLKPEDLEGIPSGASCELVIGRANYSRLVTEQSDKAVGIVSYSIVASYFTKQ